jgi:hypothetical protein
MSGRGTEIDKDLHSRLLAVFGSNIHFSGLQDLGSEFGKHSSNRDAFILFNFFPDSCYLVKRLSY